MSYALSEITDIKLTHISGEHPYHKLFKDQAQDQWVVELEKKPELFDGNVMLFTQLDVSNGELIGKCHSTPYSTFLHWRTSDQKIGCHLFGMCLIISKEGFPLVAKMAAHTFRAGKVYAPSGSLDDDDVRNGDVDIFSNMKREISEETGLDLQVLEKEKSAYLLEMGWRKVFFCRYFSPLSAEELCASINKFIASDPEAELSDIFAIKQKGGYEQSLAAHMPIILDWHFDNL